MTNQQKNVIIAYRNRGLSYGMIAKLTSISYDAVKTFCWRNGIQKNAATATSFLSESYCKECGALVQQNPKRKFKSFCSDNCRRAWWAKNRNLGVKKTAVECTCALCGKVFLSYSSQNRKYCSHSCYIQDRFGGKERATPCAMS